MSVNCDTGGNLQAKINAAASGSTILVKGTCFGNFQILGKGLTLKGNPTATLDGNDLFVTLKIDDPGMAVHIVGLTITGGAANGGSGIWKLDGVLTLDKVTVTGNLASNTVGEAVGGGVFSEKGNVTLVQSSISSNRVLATDTAATAVGGGLFVQEGNLTITGSKITGNRVSARPSSGTATARGGGFQFLDGVLKVKGTTISGNRVTASSPDDTVAQGSAAWDGSDKVASFNATTVSANSSSATSSGGNASTTGALDLEPTTSSVTGSRILDNTATSTSSAGQSWASGIGIFGSLFSTVHISTSRLAGNVGMSTGTSTGSEGGGVSTGGLSLVRSTVDGNRLVSTSSGSSALAEGGGLDVTQTTTTVTASTISRNHLTAKTTAAGAQANAFGGGGYVSELKATNSTIAFNTVSATSPHGIFVDGGGLDSYSCCFVVDSTVAHNALSGTAPSIFGLQGGGLYTSSGLTLKNTILANNTALTGPDCYGGPTSKGHNLIRNTAGCSFTKQSTDKVGKDPKLGLLANNGGPTQTMAISLSSPALNAIPKAACAVSTDQRGVHRPQGPACDIGAYERKVA